jgi:hypothetical protein
MSVLLALQAVFFLAATTYYGWAFWNETRPIKAHEPDAERRKIFADDSGQPNARLDLGLAITSVFTAIGMASLAEDLVRWRAFFHDFLKDFGVVFQRVFDLLPFHVPPDVRPLATMTLLFAGILARWQYLDTKGRLQTASEAIRDFVQVMAAFVLLVSALFLLGRSYSNQTIIFALLLLFAVMIVRGTGKMVLSARASDRLGGFYMVQTAGWCVLWGLVVLFLGAQWRA